ncbi:MAG: histidine phosphatase family protein [Pseudobdellovibrio sp.]
MTIILIRHGHKAMQPADNPTLSPKGYEQSHKLLTYVKNNQLPAPTHCFFTDKIRTYETLQEIIKVYQPKTELKTDLNLHHHLETSLQFRQRVQKCINYFTFLSSQPELHHQIIYLCTHYDWIEEAMSIIDCDQNLNSFEYVSWAPAQFIEFEIIDHIWHIKSKGSAYV